MTEYTDAPGGTDSPITIAWSSFLIRFYREGVDGTLRGEIVHLQTQDKQRIGALSQIFEFLLKYIPDMQQIPGAEQPIHTEYRKE